MKNRDTFFAHIGAKNELSASILLILLLSADVAFIILHIICKFNITDNWEYSPYNISKDKGYAEFFQYTKYIWLIILFLYILISTKSFSYISWILVFVYFLCDDAFQIHEGIGNYFAWTFDFVPPLNLRVEDIGEMSGLAAFGLVLFVLLSWAYIRGSHTFKQTSKDMLLFVVAFFIFGVVFDMLYVAVNLPGIGIGLIEESGEMIVISLTLWYVFQLAVRKGNSELFLVDLLSKSLIRPTT